MSRGEVVLFLGAGFSLDAKDHQGQQLPTSRQLTKEIWNITFPNDEYDESAALGDTFHCAVEIASAKLNRLLQQRLSVQSESLPDHYDTWLSMPWFRCYSLNIDDLEVAAQQKFSLRRQLKSISAVYAETARLDRPDYNLEFVHLNGMLGDPVESLTFSESNFGARLSTPDSWLSKVSADMIAKPVVYVGTGLHEPTIWRYIEARKQKGDRSAQELRPGSYLITPSLSKPRQRLLKGLNIDWIPTTAKEFADDWLLQMKSEKEEGHKTIRALHTETLRSNKPQLISDLSVEDLREGSKEYLLGQHPLWGDLLTGRAIRRDCDETVYRTAKKILESNQISPPLLITGTAGSGKSTTLMRLALRLNGDGIPTYWINESTNLKPHLLRGAIDDTEGPVAVLIDDADLWGQALTKWSIEIPKLRPGIMFGAALRATRIEGLMEADDLGGVRPKEISIPHLTDRDIDGLLEVLDKENRLGVLKGKTRTERKAALKGQSGRQLLVAMIQVTSGRKLSEKVYEEFNELKGMARFVYGLICVVSAQRYTIDLTELLLACGRSDNTTLNAIESLFRRHLIVRKTKQTGYASRHRVIAEELLKNVEFIHLIGKILTGVVFAFANSVNSTIPKQDRRWRRLIRFMNHDYLMNVMSVDDARLVYDGIETILSWDYHYWLQYGSLEVEKGDLTVATNLLEQAKSLNDGDRLIENEYSYLLMKRAISNPSAHDSPALFDDGFDRLECLIHEEDNQSPHPYHVLGSQALAWARKASLSHAKRSSLLATALGHLRNGVNIFPNSNDLKTLQHEIKSEWLSLAVPKNPTDD